MEPTASHDRRRFDELLPWYVTGALADDDRRWVEAWLASHPEAQAALDWHRTLAKVVDERESAAPADVGWAGLASRLAADRTPAPRRATPGLGERVYAWWAGIAKAPGFALAALAIAVQTVVIGVLVQRGPSDSEYATVRGGAAATELLLQVRFRPDATEQDLRVLLNAAGARIVDGPDQLGEYLVAPRAGEVDAVRDALRASGLVANVEPFERRRTP